MRGTVAKRLRREVYADRPTNPQGRAYSVIGRFLRKVKLFRWNEAKGEQEEVEHRYAVTTIGADQYRRRYRARKRSHGAAAAKVPLREPKAKRRARNG